METSGDGTPEVVFVAETEEPQRLRVGKVLGVGTPKRAQVEVALQTVDERPEEAALMEEVN